MQTALDVGTAYGEFGTHSLAESGSKKVVPNLVAERSLEYRPWPVRG